ncbi:MAG: polymorphic toxin type 10 domain-containing protein [Proteobacteria bacterium]|nr:polymorphic toxin type 10 domain-containing protein [Pseudomonadota bacterium]
MKAHIKLNTFDHFKMICKIVLTLTVSLSVAFGQTLSSLLSIEANSPQQAETTTVYVDAGKSSASNYANEMTGRLSQRLADQGLNARIEMRSGYGCGATVCVKVEYRVDGYLFTQNVNISETITSGGIPSAHGGGVDKPSSPSVSNEASPDAIRALDSARNKYNQAQSDYDSAKSSFDRSISDLEEANSTLSSASAQLASAESRLNSAIAEENRAKTDAAGAGQRAAAAAQLASDKKTEADRLAEYKKKLATNREQLENNLRSLESDVSQLAANTNASTEPTVSAKKVHITALDAATRESLSSAAATHNAGATSLANAIGLEADVQAANPEQPINDASRFRTPATTIGGEKLRSTEAALTTAKQTLDTLSPQQREPGTRILPVAESMMYSADNAYNRGDIDQGDFAIRVTGALIEMAIGIAPLAVLVLAPQALVLMTATVAGALALDYYQAWTGQHLLTGLPLTGFERSLSTFGVAAAIIPFGSVARGGAQALSKGLQLGEELMIATKNADEAAEVIEATRNAEKLLDSAKDIGFQTARDVKDLVSSGAGKAVLEIQNTGRIATEDGFRVFARGSSLRNPIPENGTFSRVMPRAYVEELRAGRARFSRIDPTNPAINESFITAADDLAGLSKGEDIARKLALYEDQAGTVYRKLGADDVIVEFKFKDGVATSLRSPVETANNLRNYGFVPGGKTGGGAREWLIDGDAAKKGYVDLDSIKVRDIVP